MAKAQEQETTEVSQLEAKTEALKELLITTITESVRLSRGIDYIQGLANVYNLVK